jgi:hypothetical protein
MDMEGGSDGMTPTCVAVEDPSCVPEWMGLDGGDLLLLLLLLFVVFCN